MNVRSIVPKTVIWLIGSVAIVLIGLMVTARYVAVRHSGMTEFILATQQLQLETSIQILEKDGPLALQGYLQHLDRLFLGKHLLVDDHDRDLVTCQTQFALVERARPLNTSTFFLYGPVVFEKRSDDQHYRLLIEISPHFGRWELVPYFLWLLVVIVIMGYCFAVNIVRPLKRLQNAVVQLGTGNLNSRVDFQRQDEFGELGRAFNKMAERIESLMTAERLLLQDISHELRSPLTRLRFAIDVARNNGEREAGFRRVDREILRLSELIEQLLQLTRAEGDVTARNMAKLPLQELLSDSVNDFRLEAAAKQCQITLTCVEPQLEFSGDAELIRRAFENVLSNALRHAPHGSEISVNLLLDGRNATLSIRDRGSGVPEEMLSEIFKPFRRVDCDRNRDSGGVGLGLSIAQRAVYLHHGSIEARNAHPGLEILIILPIE